MELNQITVDKLAGLLKIDAKNLAEALTKADVLIELPEKIFTQSDIDILSENIQQEKYEIGKAAGKEMTLKELKKQYSAELGIELDGIKDYPSLYEKIVSFKTEKLNLELVALKENSGKETSSQLEAMVLKIDKFKQEKEVLQSQIKDNELIHQNAKLDLQKRFNGEKGNNSLLQQFSGLQFSIPKQIKNLGEEEIEKYIRTQKNNAINLFKTSYKIDYDDEGKEMVINNVTNETLKDDLQNPQKLADLIMPFAKQNYLNIQTDEKKVGRDGKIIGRKLSYAGMNEDEFFKTMKDKNIQQNTNDFDTAYSEFRKSK